MNTIPNVYRIIYDDKASELWDKLSLLDYMIVFGNQEHGWNCSKEELSRIWKISIRNSKFKYWGDVSLIYKGKLIRSLHNAIEKILDKDIIYPCHYNIYNLEGKKRINSKKQLYE